MIKKMRSYFFRGLLIILPFAATFWLLWQCYILLDNLILRHIQSMLNAAGIPTFFGMTFLLLILGILLTGLVGGNVLGRGVVAIINIFINRLPLVRTVYTAIQQVFEAILKNEKAAFSQVALIQYPRKGLYCLAFITSKAHQPINQAIGEDSWAVFLPTTPNPTSGFLLYVPKKNTIILDIPIDVAAKMIMSAGVLNDQKPIQKSGSPLKIQQIIKQLHFKRQKNINHS